MEKKIAYLTYRILSIFDRILYFFLNRSLLIWFPDFISNYKNVGEMKFYIPNRLIDWRIKTFYTKEPETLEWIDKFEEESCFWDIGANIGLYSIYSATKLNKVKVYSFEPSTSNLGVLSRNIYINSFQKKISIIPFALSDKNGMYISSLKESDFMQGGAENGFSVNFDWNGDVFKQKNEYNTVGSSIDYLIKNNILEIPNYIKIDVDGIEHLILKGGLETLKNNKIKSVLIEINFDFKDQHEKCMKIMKLCNYKLHKKEHSELFNDSKYSNQYNCIFIKNKI
jgi:FkbM family methyltransferase